MSDVLDKLTRKEKEQLRDLLIYELQPKKLMIRPEDVEFWTAVCSTTDTHKRLHRPLEDFMRSYGVEKFRACVDVFNEFVANACGTDLRPNVRMAVSTLVMQCVVDEIKNRGYEASPKTMLNLMGSLRAVVNNSYPGYASAKMLHRIVRVKENA